MKTFYSILFFIIFIAHQNATAQLKIDSFESIESNMIIAPKPLVVFIHTDWCMYCKNMENTTFKNNDVIEKLNKNFYFASLNGESHKTIKFLNNSFRFQPNGNKTGVHQLARELATVNNKVAYPTLTILNTKYEIIFQQQSFLSAKDLIKVLNKLSKNDL
ncbi:thioredoxin family protein [Aquimarina sp. 2201CG5-10]|uniref:thioredoxin family protein n=1 Tax=Aquimarina callyspongiae TaxID=3098150 RepID=UPI002AB42863|nr:thioredoxin fold domain-containing protein [Aquimarina sp. 2201CG5-10]MDY8134076.1 thioredoxin fold domain-containing protein [Aquimarina sp. 2201CG5-10]